MLNPQISVTAYKLTAAGHSNLRRPIGKPYSSSYTELLQQREPQLVLGLQRMYHELVKASAWNGPPLPLVDGQPLTHDVLSALNILDSENTESASDDAEEVVCDTIYGDAATLAATVENSNCNDTIHSSVDQHRNFAVWPTTSQMEQMPLQSFSSADTSPTTASHASSISQPTGAQSFSAYDNEWALDTQPANLPSPPRTSSTGSAELTRSPSNSDTRPANHIGPCFRTLDDPMFATLDQHTSPVFRTLDDPLFATLDGGLCEFPWSLHDGTG